MPVIKMRHSEGRRTNQIHFLKPGGVQNNAGGVKKESNTFAFVSCVWCWRLNQSLPHSKQALWTTTPALCCFYYIFFHLGLRIPSVANFSIKENCIGFGYQIL
jgi:hypothetical protein